MGVVPYWTSWTDVCNAALGRLGAAKISSLTDGTQNQVFCSQFLPEAVAEVVGVYDWRCLRTRVQLPQLTGTPINDYLYIYQLPTNFARHVNVEAIDTPNPFTGATDPNPVESTHPWSIESNPDGSGSQVLLTNATLVFLTYIQYPGDSIGLLPPSFASAIAAALALLLMMPVKKSNAMDATLTREKGAALNRAIAVDASKYEPEDDPQVRGYDYSDEKRW